MHRVALVALAAFVSSCAYTASVAVAPNGLVYVARNVSGLFGSATAEGIYACVPSGGELRCVRVRTPGLE